MKLLLQLLLKKASFSSSSSRTPSRTLQNRSEFPSFLIGRFSRRLHSSAPQPPSFGIAFDIDGVLLRGEVPIGGSPQALKRLYQDSGGLRVPYVFLTNGGGVPESKRAVDLTKQLGVNISPLQVIQGHTPFKELVTSSILLALVVFENDLIVATGKGEPAEVMFEYGFENVLSLDEYASCFEHIDPLAQYKTWVKPAKHGRTISADPCCQRVQAVFVVSDPVDWSRDIQVLCDILRTGGLPGGEIAHQTHLFFANDDLAYQALFPAERLGMGAFRIALEAVFNRIHPNTLEYTSYGKPNPFVFKNAGNVLMKILQSSYSNPHIPSGNFKTFYMVGDNPSVDINGARQAGHPWFSILTRTGVFRGKQNHADHPADLVVDDVEEAVDYILRKEGISES